LLWLIAIGASASIVRLVPLNGGYALGPTELSDNENVTSPQESEMTRKRASQSSWARSFWNFVEANPKLAASVAFQLGSITGAAVANSEVTGRFLAKRARKIPRKIVEAIPQNISEAALKFLPGPSPKLQPRKRPAQRKPKVAHRQST
jgi:hypothetical protein